jgi:signal transduction histidine kinase
MMAFLIFWIIVSSNIQKLTENYIASRLEHDIETLVAAVEFDKQNKLIINATQIDSLYNRPFSGHYYRIQHQQTLFRSRSLWDQTLPIKEITAAGYQQTYQQGPENQPLIVISRRFNKQNQTIIVSVAEDLTSIKKDINQFKNYFAIIAFAFLLILLLLQAIILHFGLKPLRKIRSELYALEKGIITKLTTDVPVELEAVVNEVNHLTLALYKRLKRSRDALSDLSHAVKKPLTLLQHFSDKNQTTFDNDSVIFLNEQIKSIQHITDRILKRARVAGNSKLNTPFNINDDLPLLIKTIAAMYPEKNINVKLDIPTTLERHFDREDMLELLGNLLDNAWKWANKTVYFSTKETDQITITIEDDGPGANEKSLNELSNRGVRLDETIDGFGFGLAIAADIIRDYNGTLLFSRSDLLGGFKVEIKIPFQIS